MKENFSIENLIKIGLIESEAKIYLNLLKKKSFTASEISRLSGISRSKTYEILNQLVKKGLCIEILGGVKRYASANPKTAFIGLQQKIQQEYETKKILMSNLSETLLPLYLSEQDYTNPMDYIQVISEKNRIVEKVESLERMATNEILAFTKAPYAMSINKSGDEQEFINLKRGIKCKSIYEVDEAKKPDFLKMIELCANSGEEVRVTYELPLKFLIFDGKIVMITLKDILTSKTHLTTLVVEHSDLARFFKNTFYNYWQKAMTLEEIKIKEKI
ncbi:MAG: TrmB family transcriptional regulator [Candidatus Cloacimonetes bacterium]|nr:TrmB family transcriptional regulator [Candidatus Cloacimonadota bacterium]